MIFYLFLPRKLTVRSGHRSLAICHSAYMRVPELTLGWALQTSAKFCHSYLLARKFYAMVVHKEVSCVWIEEKWRSPYRALFIPPLQEINKCLSLTCWATSNTFERLRWKRGRLRSRLRSNRTKAVNSVLRSQHKINKLNKSYVGFTINPEHAHIGGVA